MQKNLQKMTGIAVNPEADVVKASSWTSFVLLSENPEGGGNAED